LEVSVLDSIGLVTFLAEVEDLLEEELDIEIEIADERAMSRFRSPFTNIDSLYFFRDVSGILRQHVRVHWMMY
jgi:hypothetical protein